MNQQTDAIDGAFVLRVPTGEPRSLAIGWLWLALGSLVVGGVFTILIVLSRTPKIQDLIPWVDFFHTALVVHVDLTVLVWFLAFAGVLWSLNLNDRCRACGRGALYLAVAGAGVISISPFVGAGGPLMNNYVPVLQAPVFFVGLGVFGLGFLILVLHSLFSRSSMATAGPGEKTLGFGLITGQIAALIALLALAGSYKGTPSSLIGAQYYEVLFWGGGHAIQFTHTQLMLVAWLWLAWVSQARPPLSPRVAILILGLGAAPVLLILPLYLRYEIGSAYHMLGLTWLMQYGGGLSSLPIGLAILWALARAGRSPVEQAPERNALWFSIILFGAGGIIGFLISGANVTVPAHYHGSIVSVTLAYMGVTYHLLPRFGFRRPEGWMVRWQPIIYGSGQLLHVLGLAWSGGYGVQRKTAGSAQVLHTLQETLGMGLMGLGGLIAIIGGLLFLIICFKAMWPGRSGN